MRRDDIDLVLSLFNQWTPLFWSCQSVSSLSFPLPRPMRFDVFFNRVFNYFSIAAIKGKCCCNMIFPPTWATAVGVGLFWAINKDSILEVNDGQIVGQLSSLRWIVISTTSSTFIAFHTEPSKC